MSKLDDLLNGTLVFAFDARDSRRDDLRKLILDASDELAALRQRAEDAEMIAKALSVGICTARVHWGRLSARRNGDGTWSWMLSRMVKIGEPISLIMLENDPTTGLPVLNDEARKALGGADG